MTRVGLLARDVDRLVAVRPDLAPSLGEAMFDAGLAHRRCEPELEDLPESFVHLAAACSSYRARIGPLTASLAHVEDRERASYEEQLVLDRDLLPPLREEAKRLRAEIATLEGALRAKGVDPSPIGPGIENATVVDDAGPPRLVDPRERRAEVSMFFRRIREDG